MALIAFLSFILGRPVFFLFLFLDGNNGVILFHKASGTSYSESTPVISDITIDHKRVQYGLALSYKYSMAKTQLISITFRIGSYQGVFSFFVSFFGFIIVKINTQYGASHDQDRYSRNELYWPNR